VDHADVVDVEVLGGVGETVDAGPGDECAEEVAVVGHLGSDGGLDGLGDGDGVAGVVDALGDQRFLVEEGEGALGCLLVAEDDLTRVQAHADEVLGVAE
jgi:hypothetical protein